MRAAVPILQRRKLRVREYSTSAKVSPLVGQKARIQTQIWAHSESTAILDKHTVGILRMNQFMEQHFFSVNLYKTPQIEELFSHWQLGVCGDR